SSPVRDRRNPCWASGGCVAPGRSEVPWPSHVVRGRVGASPARGWLGEVRSRRGWKEVRGIPVLAGARALCKCFSALRLRCIGLSARGPAGQLPPRRDREFAEDVGDVARRRGLTDGQARSDLPIGQALPRQLRDLAFTP